MKSPTRRIKQVYIDLGRVLDSPESFGLGERAPKPLVNAMTAMRETLKQEMIELKQWDNGDLSDELSQDTDSRSVQRRTR